ncbi:hypothetical protein FOMPIDRAFT_1056782, partial [Fomitopsis schrenkii]
MDSTRHAHYAQAAGLIPLQVVAPCVVPYAPATALAPVHSLLSNYMVRPYTYPRVCPPHRVISGAGPSIADTYRTFNNAMQGAVGFQVGDRANIGSNHVYHFEDVTLPIDGENLRFHRYALAQGAVANVPAGEIHADIRYAKWIIVHELASPQPDGHILVPGLTTHCDPNTGIAIPFQQPPVPPSPPLPPAPAPSRATNEPGRTPARLNTPLRNQAQSFMNNEGRSLPAISQCVEAIRQSEQQLPTIPANPPVTVPSMRIEDLVHDGPQDFVSADLAAFKPKGVVSPVPCLAYPTPSPTTSESSLPSSMPPLLTPDSSASDRSRLKKRTDRSETIRTDSEDSSMKDTTNESSCESWSSLEWNRGDVGDDSSLSNFSLDFSNEEASAATPAQ